MIMLLHTTLLFSAALMVSASDTTVQRLDGMVVRAVRETPHEKLDVDSAESRIGQVDDLVEVIVREAGVARTQAAGAQYLVRGDGPYDNMVLIRGVRTWFPSHFAWDGFAGRSVFTVATGNDITFHTDEIAGLYGGASGSVLRVDPTIIRAPRLLPRPEITINGGRIGADLSLMVPARRAKDLYQLSAKVSDRYAVWNNKISEYSGNHWSPSRFADGQFLGQQSIGKLRVEQLAWVALDTYVYGLSSMSSGFRGNQGSLSTRPPEEMHRPWGIWALTVEDSTGEEGWGVTAGRARQFDIRRTKLSERDVTRTGASFSMRTHSMNLGGPRLRLRFDTDWARWEGEAKEISPRFDERGYYRGDSVTTHVREGHETNVGIHIGYESRTDRSRFGLNLRPGFLWPAGKVVLDPGFWIRWPTDRFTVTVSGGGISATPDVRGMPSPAYAQKLIRTWRGDLGIDIRPVRWLALGAEGFVKWKDHVPQTATAPHPPTWDETADGMLLAYGVDLELGLSLGQRVHMGVLQSIGRSWVLEDQARSRYEWDVPWSTKPYLAVRIIPDALHLHVAGMFAAAVPATADSADFAALSWGEEMSERSGFQNVGLKLQFHQDVEGHRYLRQFDAYLQLTDILGIRGGIGELMHYGLLAIGVRFRFRL